jgi:hypothetical protein
MAIRIRFPAALERYCPEREITVEATTVDEALAALPEALRERVLDEAGRVRPHLIVSVDGDLVELVAAVEGG